MMRPFVVHAFKKFFARILAAETAKFNFFIPRTIPEFTISYRIVYRGLLTTAGAILCPARTAEKTTRAKL